MPDDLRDYGKRTRDHVRSFGHFMDQRREFKRQRFVEKISSNYQGPVILAEGDSWFEYPMAEDLLMPLGEKYAILSLAKAGDSFTEVEDQNELFPTLKKPPHDRPFHIVMLSLGGNEVLGGIEKFAYDNDPARPDENYVRPEFADMLEKVRDKYEKIVDPIVKGGDRHVILHGYDYPDPRYPPEPTQGPTGAQWIGPPLLHQRRIGQLTTYREIANQMLDRFNATIEQVANKFGNRVHYVRLHATHAALEDREIAFR